MVVQWLKLWAVRSLTLHILNTPYLIIVFRVGSISHLVSKQPDIWRVSSLYRIHQTHEQSWAVKNIINLQYNIIVFTSVIIWCNFFSLLCNIDWAALLHYMVKHICTIIYYTSIFCNLLYPDQTWGESRAYPGSNENKAGEFTTDGTPVHHTFPHSFTPPGKSV